MNQKINFNTLKSFLSSFICEIKSDKNLSGTKNCIFTTNHDLLIERIFWKAFQGQDKWPLINGGLVSSNGKNKFNMLTRNEEIKVTEVKDESNLYSSLSNMIIYFKLHGSDKWQYEKNILMVTGVGKSLAINSSDLLKKYFETFESVLTDNSIVFVIGYGFNDSHINEALLHRNVKLQILSPQPLSQFYSEMARDSVKMQLWKKVNNYYQNKLCDVFPRRVKYSPLLQKIEENIWK